MHSAKIQSIRILGECVSVTGIKTTVKLYSAIVLFGTHETKILAMYSINAVGTLFCRFGSNIFAQILYVFIHVSLVR